jgi:hypothetical protein
LSKAPFPIGLGDDQDAVGGRPAEGIEGGEPDQASQIPGAGEQAGLVPEGA